MAIGSSNWKYRFSARYQQSVFNMISGLVFSAEYQHSVSQNQISVPLGFQQDIWRFGFRKISRWFFNWMDGLVFPEEWIIKTGPMEKTLLTVSIIKT